MLVFEQFTRRSWSTMKQPVEIHFFAAHNGALTILLLFVNTARSAKVSFSFRISFHPTWNK